ncbi:MAG: hypothetical protein AB7V50_04985, partial [Vampirovibrionia bacterium]
VTSFESIFLGGADNIIIPVGSLYILSKITTKPPEEIMFQLSLILIVFLVVLMIVLPAKKIGLSGIVGVSLISYGTCALVGVEWFIPVVLSLLLIFTTDIFIGKPFDIECKYRIRSVFYVLLPALLWLLLANYDLNNRFIYFIPFTVAILSHLLIMWEGRLREYIENNETKPVKFLSIPF